MRSIFLVIVLMFISLSAFAKDAEFILLDQREELKEGDIIDAVLRVWPVENNNGEELRKYINQNLFGSFFLLDIESISPSINNADVIELKGTFAVSSKLDPENLFVDFDGEKIRVKYKEVLFRPHQTRPIKFEILEQDVGKKYLKWIIIFAVLVVICLWGYQKKNTIKLMFLKKSIESEYDSVRELFLRASTRIEYEEIYKKRNLWMNKLKEITPAHTEFINIINEHQYKKEWSFFEKNEVEEAFSKIKRSLP